MRITICENKMELGRQAAVLGRHHIKATALRRGWVNVAFVTGKSQLEMLKVLRALDIDWTKANIFLIDEYVGLEDGHKASSETFLKENFLKYIPEPKSFHHISRSSDTDKTISDLNALMKDYPLDVAFICIGDNGHLGFNDPPADLDTNDPYILVEIDQRSKRQHVNEGWFGNVKEVPETAITMSVNEILSAKYIVCACPEREKAMAVAMTLYDEISSASPCASLRMRSECTIFLDRQSSYLCLSDLRDKR